MKIVRIGAGNRRAVVQTDAQVIYQVAEGAEVNVVVQILNSNISDYSVIVELLGRGAKATITGVIIGKGETQIKLHTLQHHSAPETTSDLLVKGVLYGQAKLAYDGKIVVDKEAQKTDAYQRNENLLMGHLAKAESKPGLEIFANDVRCTHGATVGMIDAEQMWYLKSRGIEQSVAENLIVNGFLSSGFVRITDELVREELMRKINKYL